MHLLSSQREKGNSPGPYLMKDCFPYFTGKLYFQFLAQKGNVWPRLRIYQAQNQLRDVMRPFGVSSGPKPQWNKHVISFLWPQRSPANVRITVMSLTDRTRQPYYLCPLPVLLLVTWAIVQETPSTFFPVKFCMKMLLKLLLLLLS